MMVTIQEALQAVKGATPDDLRTILDVLRNEGLSGDNPAGSDFLGLDAKHYKDTLKSHHRKLIRTAQRSQGGGPGVLLGCMFVTAQLHAGAS